MCTRTPADRPGQQQRVRHVVAVADVGEGAALEVALELAQRLQVGQRLAGMGEVGERVDDRHVGTGGQLLEPVLAEGAHHDGVDVAAQHCGGVAQRFAAAELGGARVDDHRVAAELVDADLERHPGAGGGLLEDDGDAAPGQRAASASPGPSRRRAFSASARSSTSACSAGERSVSTRK